MNPKLMVFAGAVVGALLLAGCTANDDGGTVVEMKDVKFVPERIEVEPGTKVTWVNRDSIQHNVASDDEGGPLDSALLNAGQTYSYTFTEPGVYKYHCHPHARPGDDGTYGGMIGTAVVLDEDGTQPTDGGADNGTNDNGTA